jgi:hypothetical protein
MTHISRPFQIALAALVLFLAVWFVALRGHSSGVETSGSSSSSGGAPAASTPSASSSSSAQGAPGGGTPASQGGVYHGSAPGVEGLSRAIQRARGAVAQSQHNGKGQEAGQSSGSAGRSQAQQQTQTSQSRSAQHSATPSRPSAQAQSPQQSRSASGVPAMQAVVEGELKHGKVVAVLFWNPKGAVDDTVRRELRAAGRAQHGTLAVHVARSREVGLFGSFTRTVQVYSTPTILLINRHGKTSSLTGLTDAFSIEQAINEVKRVK